GQSTALSPGLTPDAAAVCTVRCQPDPGPRGVAVRRMPPPSSTPRPRFRAGQSRPVIAVVPPAPPVTVAVGGLPSVTVARPGVWSGTRQLVALGQAMPVSSPVPSPAGSITGETVKLDGPAPGSELVATLPSPTAA